MQLKLDPICFNAVCIGVNVFFFLLTPNQLRQLQMSNVAKEIPLPFPGTIFTKQTPTTCVIMHKEEGVVIWTNRSFGISRRINATCYQLRGGEPNKVITSSFYDIKHAMPFPSLLFLSFFFHFLFSSSSLQLTYSKKSIPKH